MEPRVYIILRNDDPCALSDVSQERRLLSLFENFGVPLVAGVVPRMVTDPHDARAEECHPLHLNASMVSLLKEYRARGVLEIAQHGDAHRTSPLRPTAPGDRASPDAFPGMAGPWLPFRPAHPEGYSEFNGLSVAEQRAKILAGKEYLEKLLAVRLETFIFPWNSYSRDSLKILRDAGFRYVLAGEEDELHVSGLLTIACCSWGVDEFMGFVEDALAQEAPALVHLSFHSWMLTDDDFAHLDALLARFAAHEEVSFIGPSRIPSLPYDVASTVRRRLRARRLALQVSRHLRTRHLEEHEFYVFRPWHYHRQILRLAPTSFVFGTLGLSRMLAVSGAITLVCAYLLMRTADPWTFPSLLAGPGLAVGGAVFLFTLRLFVTRVKQHRAERVR